MKHAFTTILVAALATAAISSASYAVPGGGNEKAKILVHLMGPTTKGACTRAMPNCDGIVTHGNLSPAVYYAYVLVVDGNTGVGIAGLQFGITYGSGATDNVGLDIWSWTLCGTLEFQQPSPVWPSSGGGNLVTWDAVNSCQRTVPAGGNPDDGVTAAAGYFYCGAYGDATLTITPRPVDGMAKVANCAAAEDNIEGDGLVNNPSHLGHAGFGGATGYSPCGLGVPVENTTWGAVKSMYNSKK